jgi:hypothetical protein
LASRRGEKESDIGGLSILFQNIPGKEEGERGEKGGGRRVKLKIINWGRAFPAMKASSRLSMPRILPGIMNTVTSWICTCNCLFSSHEFKETRKFKEKIKRIFLKYSLIEQGPCRPFFSPIV